jgi:hypothetical protein
MKFSYLFCSSTKPTDYDKLDVLAKAMNAMSLGKSSLLLVEQHWAKVLDY